VAYVTRDWYKTASAAVVAGVLIVFITDLVTIFTTFASEASWIRWIMIMIGAPFIVGYIIAAWEWIGGRD